MTGLKSVTKWFGGAALMAAMFFGLSHKAEAQRVSFGVQIGTPVYAAPPAYDYGYSYAAVPAYGYYDRGYAYYGNRYYDRDAWRHREFVEHERWERERHYDRDRDYNRGRNRDYRR